MMYLIVQCRQAARVCDRSTITVDVDFGALFLYYLFIYVHCYLIY